MSSQLELLKRELEMLREDLERKRIKVSEASKDLSKYCESTPDPLVSNDKNNPFKQKASNNGVCLVI
eukprot:TRINITY_DN136588_c0_g1_i1.p1 TRINITY_DN136588_c0_g1~~TRINITY_DN136588_c0_g1_i1.p1  ORF type:complete len:67 (-),score=12.08 TRINITY_DN136588_c0_g1_i1:47-247(-)